jgi:hypothetical protein
MGEKHFWPFFTVLLYTVKGGRNYPLPVNNSFGHFVVYTVFTYFRSLFTGYSKRGLKELDYWSKALFTDKMGPKVLLLIPLTGKGNFWPFFQTAKLKMAFFKFTANVANIFSTFSKM